MELLAMALAREVPQLQAEGVRIHFVGDRAALSDKVRAGLAQAESGDRRQHAPGLQHLLQLRRPLGHRAGGRTRWPRAASRSPSRAWTAAMALAHVPDPDLLIRTGGEQRISNFLLWQAAYSELYFSDKLWPEFDEAALDEAIADYAQPRAPLRQDLRAGAHAGGRPARPPEGEPRMLKQRIITAVVLLAILLPALFWRTPEPFLRDRAGADRRRRPGSGAGSTAAARAGVAGAGAACAAAVRGGLGGRAGSTQPLPLLWIVAGAALGAGRRAAAARRRGRLAAGCRGRCAWSAACWRSVARLAGGGAGPRHRRQLPAVGPGAGVGRRHLRLFRRPRLRPEVHASASWRPRSVPARAGKACGAAWPACWCWPSPGSLADRALRARRCPASTRGWQRTGWWLLVIGVAVPGGDERGGRPGRVAGQAQRRRQGSSSCCRATAACSTASMPCCRRCRWR